MEGDLFDIFEDDTKLKIPLKIAREEPRTEIRDEFFENGTWHEAVIPFKSSYFEIPHVPKCDAKKYKFDLDTFQKISVASIERDESVLVSAHTSCGKTVVAEYAIAQSIKNKQRVVYTSPIKALSNQKFRELQEEFHDVGLMTGDVTINPEASCLVMTTEILRNMLYRGSEVIREVHWIVFDEIHYMRDKERGVVWEETLILLPRHVRVIFLSATIPNAREFAEWVSYISQQIVHVVYTEKRVIPLIHYFQTDNLYLIKDTKFNLKNFKKAVEYPVKRANIDKAVAAVLEKVNVPAVVFSFSRKECETYACKIAKDFLTDDEKETVKVIFDNAIASLREEDRKIPIIERMLPLLQRGIGIHHSGLLPIIREIVEILFQESLVKVLFATETFSIGLNMPAKTVIFTALRKFDGESRRLLTSGEYIQMSGRAGRRGLDDQGIAISILCEELTVSQAKEIFSSTSDKLLSAFRLTYNMVLNLMRVEGLDPLFVLSRSFFHFQAYKNALEQENKLLSSISKKKTTKRGLDCRNGNTLKDSKRAQSSAPTEEIEDPKSNSTKINDNIEEDESIEEIDIENENSQHIKKLFCTATEVEEEASEVLEDLEANELANLLINREGLIVERNKKLAATYKDYIRMKGRVVDITIPRLGAPLLLRNCIVKTLRDSNVQVFVLTNNDIELKEYPIDYVSEVYDIRCKVDIKVFNKKFAPVEYKDDLNDEIEKIESEIRKIVPDIDLQSCLFCRSPARSCLLRCDYQSSWIEVLDSATEYIKNLLDQEDLQDKIEQLNKLKEIYHMAECKRMIQVLRRLDYIDDTSVLLKGKMASEISTGDELVLTEMIFNTKFPELPLIDMVALLSCTICEEKNDSGFVLSEENEKLFEILIDSAKRVCSVMRECGIDVTEESFIKKFSFELMDVVRLWMSGHTFIEICDSTSVFEGNIIRTFKRLEELLRQLSNAAIVIGNSELVNLFSQGIFLIKRDIVFANSLYL